jgi:hypothetical protein
VKFSQIPAFQNGLLVARVDFSGQTKLAREEQVSHLWLHDMAGYDVALSACQLTHASD